MLDMNTGDFYDLIAVLPSIRDIFVGVFPIDVVPRNLRTRHFAIVNTE